MTTRSVVCASAGAGRTAAITAADRRDPTEKCRTRFMGSSREGIRWRTKLRRSGHRRWRDIITRPASLSTRLPGRLDRQLARRAQRDGVDAVLPEPGRDRLAVQGPDRSEEHTSELQSRLHLVCRLLLEKKKQEHSCT